MSLTKACGVGVARRRQREGRERPHNTGIQKQGKDKRKADGIIQQSWPTFLMKSKERQQIRNRINVKLNVKFKFTFN